MREEVKNERQVTRPRATSSAEEAVSWNPETFQSARLKSVYAEAHRFAPLNVPVLILGERGTGKTTLAGWIREQSPFRKAQQDAHWPAVPCGQYTSETMRAELFGYVKGAFTGAHADKAGLLKAADGDTLFLDEIGDMSGDLQRLLIKVLEEKRYHRLGEDRPQRSRFRLITATNLPWDTLRKRLDDDFLDRVATFTLRLPSLRQIREDIPWLWKSAYEQAARRAGRMLGSAEMTRAVEPMVLKFLRSDPLPGNLRDLFKLAYRLLAADADTVEPMTNKQAVEFAISGLQATAEVSDGEESTSQAVARRFSRGHSLDDLMPAGTVLPTTEIIQEIRTYLADEIRRVARSRGISVEGLADVTGRTLRNWAGAPE